MMSMTTSPLAHRADLARQLLGHHGYAHGTTPGGFTESMFITWAKADRINRARLGAAFPEYYLVVTAFEDGGAEALLSLAEDLDLAAAA